MNSHSRIIAAGIAACLAAPGVARAEHGRLLGWVEDTHGAPVAGVVISLFGRGLEGGGVVTLSDSAGRFFLPSLPAGSYTIRAVGEDAGAAAREITVLPNQDSIFTLNLEEAAAAATGRQASTDVASAEPRDEEDLLRELRWLLRHKRRSVLEQRDADPAGSVRQASLSEAPGFDGLPSLAGAVEVLANPLGFGEAPALEGLDSVPSSTSVLRLEGRLTESVAWRLAGLLAESESTTWRTAAEFLVEPGAGHHIVAGAGYGTRLLRPLIPLSTGDSRENRTLGSLFLQDTWEMGERVTASFGARYSYVGFVADPNHINPMASLEVRGDDGTRVRGSFAVQTVAPGGDLLTVSSLGSAPEMAFALVQDRLQPERVTNATFEVERALGGTSVGLHAFHEEVDDPLVNVASGDPLSRTLRIFNAPGLASSGGGVSVSHRFGTALRAAVSYTYGRSRRDGPAPGLRYGLLNFRSADFHDVVTRLEAFLRATDTRLVALYRVNALDPEGDGPGGQSTTVSNRFDVQVTQGLPFLADMTRADWELLLSYRNLFYEDSEGAILDEIAVVNPPRRIVGGIAIRF